MDERKGTTPQWQVLLDQVREVHPEVVAGAMFGMPCAKVAGKTFMGPYAGGAVFKLGSPEHERALGLAGSEV